MQREILYRGKVTDGEWIEGMPWIFKDKSCICQWHEGMCDRDTGFMPMYVIPETVGQFTGKTDKKRKKIFEGDIVICDKHIAKVVFNKITCGFEIWWNVVVGAYGEKATFKRNFAQIDTIKVIGNIYDNPELLEGHHED